LAKGAAVKDENIKSLSNKYSKTPAQIAIKWSLEVVQ
jgi:diketogulonate reductase-like aldo/keto reductase